jgi:hypothetical protein
MTSMENMMHNYLVKLRVISKIPERGRLDTSHNDLNIYYGGLLGWLFRKAYGDNKEASTKYLIELYKEINAFSDQLMYNITMEHNEILKRKKITMIVSLAEKMKSSLVGIRNLIGTYKDYLKIVSLLENLEQDIIIPQYKLLLKFLPESYHTELLRSPITYSYIHNSGLMNSRVHELSENDMQFNIPISDPLNIDSPVRSTPIQIVNSPAQTIYGTPQSTYSTPCTNSDEMDNKYNQDNNKYNQDNNKYNQDNNKYNSL